MGRPALPIGTYGNIKTTTQAGGGVKARALFRMADGSYKEVCRFRATKTAAVNAVKSRMVVLAAEVSGGEITAETRMAHIGKMWLADLEEDARLGEISHDTARVYRGTLKNWVLPALGELCANEVKVLGCEKLFTKARDDVGYATAKTVRAVTGAICGYAVRHGAMDVNPVRSAKKLAGEEEKEVRSLTLEQIGDLKAKLIAHAEDRKTDAKGRSLGKRAQVWFDLPDIMEAMLSTGVRIGELLAQDGGDVDPAKAEVVVGHHIVRVPGQGLVRQKLRKGNKDGLLLAVPEWSVPMWRRRKLASGGGPIFPSWNGEWLDPSNVINRIRDAMEACGYGWVTSHVFRKTVATLLDEADLPVTAIADQLGNSPKVVERHYRRKRTSNKATAAALEGLA